jgi:hypothetical protein
MMFTDRALVSPLLLIISFPVLYYGGQQGSDAISVLGLALMFGGVATPTLAKITRNTGIRKS